MGYGDPSRRGANWRLAAWGVLTLFMMAWAFVLGLLVGQGSLATPEQLAAIKDASHAVPGLGLLVREEPPPPPEQPQPRDLTFYREVERKADSPATPGSVPTTVTSTVSTATTATTATTASTATTLAAKAPVSSTTTTTPSQRFVPQPYVPPPGWVPPPRPLPSAPPAAAANPNHARPSAPAPPASAAPAAKGRFTVQVASFKDEEPARELLGQLKAAGHPAYLVSAAVEGVGTRYRVRVGPFQDLDAAQGAAARIRMQLLLAAYVTRD